MEYTKEQLDIINTDVSEGQTMKVIAFAGASKTTSLRAYTEFRPNSTFLYLAFNASVAAEARETFPPNVTAKTTHSLAYRMFGFKYKNKLNFAIRPYQVADALNIKKFGVAKYLIAVVENYLCSSDAEIEEKHLILNGEDAEEFRHNKDLKNRSYLLDKAKELWVTMRDVRNTKVPMIHDGYLKIYQLSKPVLNFDYILLDECHDTNGVVLDIFLSQKKCRKILVGDDHQSIYQFRKAFNAVKTAPSDINFLLTTSFRFGNNIAELANSVLSTFKKEKNKLKGFQLIDKVDNVNECEPYAIIARTNGAIFDEAVKLLESGRRQSFGFVGTLEKKKYSPLEAYYFNKILDVYNLYNKNRGAIKDAYIKRFRNFAEFQETVNDKLCPDVDLASRARVVLKYKHSVPELIRSIISNSINPANARVVFSTAHKAKGMEFNQVKLTSDFADLIVEEDGNKRLANAEEIDDQEINLLYVALTRAKNVLQPNKQLNSLQQFLKEI